MKKIKENKTTKKKETRDINLYHRSFLRVISNNAFI